MPKYTDIDFLLSKNELTNDVNTKLDINAISQAIKNIILTSKTEKPFNQTFGANGLDIINENFSELQKKVLSSNITAEIRLQEPRAEIRQINIEKGEAGTLIITVSFSPIYAENIVRTLNLEVTGTGE